MIHGITIRRFKQFEEVTFQLNGMNMVLAGRNSTGKTTILQAIAAWSLAFQRWKELNDFQRHGGYYTKAPIARQAFSAVPLRRFDLMWANRDYTGIMEIEIESTDGWAITIEFIADSTEQIFLRPARSADPAALRDASLESVFVPAMTGLSKEEPLYARPETVADLLGRQNLAMCSGTCCIRRINLKRPGTPFAIQSKNCSDTTFCRPMQQAHILLLNISLPRMAHGLIFPALAAAFSRF